MTMDYIYKCSDCEEAFERKFDFLEHKNIHSKETPFMCVSCRKSFSLVKEYVDHIKCKRSAQSSNSHQSNDVVNGLEEPDQILFENSQEFGDESNIENKEPQNSDSCDCCACLSNNNKVKNTFEKDTESFKCESCSKVFSTKLKLLGHSCFVTTSEENLKCSCSLTFTKISNFKAHIGEKPYSCCSCSMQFNTITNLIRHIRTHTKQKPYVCKDCGRGFSQSANLRNHLSIHLGVRAITCNECDFSCKTLNGLIKHKKKHMEGINIQNYVDGRKKSTNKITCPICHKQFMFKRNMGMHMKIHLSKVSLCTECGKVFDSKSKLTSHYKACHREPSVCKTCGKVFASAVLLNAHEKIHVSDKLFSCDFCQKTFSVKNYLVQHMKTHSNEKQFSCCKCGKLFKVAVSLKYHSNICSSLTIPV